jgi:dihydroorotase
MIRIRKPDDFHLHIRQGGPLAKYLGDTAAVFARALIMPNTVPPVNSAGRLSDYRRAIAEALGPQSRFQALLTFKITPGIGEAELDAMLGLGLTAGKYYPLGATTNAEDGVADHRSIFPLLELMERRNLVLCIHGEDPDAFVLDRETAFLPVLRDIRENFPDLRIVLEHISTREGLEAVRELGPNTAGTITVHHLMRNLDDLLGGLLNPHLFCKPVLKRPEDQAALIEAAFGGEQRFFLGTDSAPHLKDQKECDCGCAGTYTAPVAIPALFQFYMERVAGSDGDVSAFQAFVSENGARFYRLPLNEDHINLVREPWTVAPEYHGVVPFLAGRTLDWRVR